MDFIFGLPQDADVVVGVVVFVDWFSKMVHVAPVPVSVSAEYTAVLFVDIVFRHHGLPSSIVSNRDPRSTPAFWTRLFELLGTRLTMFTAAHPETDGQTKPLNRFLEDVLHSYAKSYSSWSSFLPLAEFALNNAVHVTTGITPFVVNNARHPRVPALLAVGPSTDTRGSTLGEGGTTPSTGRNLISQCTTVQNAPAGTGSDKSINVIAEWAANSLIIPGQSAAPSKRAVSFPALRDPTSGAGSDDTNFENVQERTAAGSAAISEFPLQRQSVVLFVRDAVAQDVDKQKENADRRKRKDMDGYIVGDKVLLSVAGVQPGIVTNLGANKLLPRFIGPFTVLEVKGDAYTFDMATTMRHHTTFYVRRLKRYYPSAIPGAASQEQDPVPPPGHGRPSSTRPGRRDGLPSPREISNPQRRCSRRLEDLRAAQTPPTPREDTQHDDPSAPDLLFDVGQTLRRGLAPTPPTIATGRTNSDPMTSDHQGTRSRGPLDNFSRVGRNLDASSSAPATFRHDGPPSPVVGDRRWIVDHIVVHADDPHGPNHPGRGMTRGRTQRVPLTRRYRERWLGYPPADDTWEARETLLAYAPTVVATYEAKAEALA